LNTLFKAEKKNEIENGETLIRFSNNPRHEIDDDIFKLPDHSTFASKYFYFGNFGT
jgi:hypothetical protein